MSYSCENLAIKKDNIAPDYNLSIEDLYVDEKIKNHIKKGQSYKYEIDLEESISNKIINNTLKVFELNINLDEEKEEDFKIYHHTSGTIDKNIRNLLSSQVHPLFKIKVNNPDDKPNKNSNFRNNIRYKERQRRYTNQDNVRRIIKRRFFNTYLKNALNEKMKKSGYKELYNFPQKLVSDITIKNNKELINMTLFQIFEKNDSYGNKDLKNFEYNLNIVKKIKINEKAEMNFIMNKKFCELFEEYINSDEFEKEIKRVSSKHKNEIFYIQRYKYLAQTFIEYYLK